MPEDDKIQGEGNYEASRNYRKGTEEFIESGQVDRAAEDAANATPDEQQDLERAEQEGRRHAAEEDAQLRGRTRRDTSS